MQTKTLQHTVTFKASPQEVLRHVDGFEETPVVSISLKVWSSGLWSLACDDEIIPSQERIETVGDDAD